MKRQPFRVTVTDLKIGTQIIDRNIWEVNKNAALYQVFRYSEINPSHCKISITSVYDKI